MFHAHELTSNTNNYLKNEKLHKTDYIFIGVSCVSSELSREPEVSCKRVIAYVKNNIAKTMEETGKNKMHNEELVKELADGKILAVFKTWIYWGNT
jgi:hypothetical protein